MEDALEQVTQDVDKRDGSIIYDGIAPCMYEIANLYFALENYVDLLFADTSVGEYLDRAVYGSGLERKQATYAIRMIETNNVIDIDTRWGVNDLIYTVIEQIDTTHYKAICNTLGEIGNTYSGTLDNIDNVNNIVATLTDIIESGQDEESDDALRERFYTTVRRASTSGNENDYKNWALQVTGVGDAKVFPLWNGNGTVKVLIVNTDKKIDDTLETKVYEYIEQNRPIGATVTVDSPIANNISITANVVLSGKTLEEVQATYNKAVDDYFTGIVFSNYTVSYAKLGSLLLSCEGVEDYSNLLVNGATENITVSDDAIPVLSSAVLSE